MNHDKLRQLAQAATPGPWTLEYDSDTGEYGENYGEWPNALNGPKSQTEWLDPKAQEKYGHQVNEISDMCEADAEFIAAANPTVVLALLDELRGAKAKLADAWEDGYWAGDGDSSKPDTALAHPNPYREDTR